MNRIKYISILFLLLLCFFLNACKTEDEKVNYKEIIPQEIEELLSDNSNYSCKMSGSDDINLILYNNKDECLIEANVEIGNYDHNFPDLFVDKNALKSYIYYNKNIVKTWGLHNYATDFINDEEVAKEFFDYIPLELLNNKDFVLDILENEGIFCKFDFINEYISEELRQDYDVLKLLEETNSGIKLYRSVVRI